MLNATAILIAIALYLGLLVGVGWRADHRVSQPDGRWRAIRYGLSLATLCSAWTYFGAVGDASRGSWLFVANAIGPVLAITLFAPVWRRIAVLAKQENVGSLADFLAARYGKSRPLGILVTCVATLGALPYIALQLAVLTHVWAFAIGRAGGGGLQALLMIAVLVAMAMVFGTRRPSLTQHSRGFVSIIAIESGVKLSGLLAVAGLSLYVFFSSPHPAASMIGAIAPFDLSSLGTFVTLTLLCTATAFTLPRQFHLGFVALEAAEDIGAASKVVPLYFGLWVAATLVIAMGIRSGLGMQGISPYLQMLAIPMVRGDTAIAMVAWLGGISAGGAMVVVELTAISAMVSNEIVLPLVSRAMRERRAGSTIGGLIVLVRRVTMVVIAGLAWVYYLGVRGVEGPTDLGLTALTAFAQLVPPLLGGIYWRRGHAHGALAGVAAGIVVWAIAIAAPAFVAPLGAPADGLGNDLWPIHSGSGVQSAIFTSLIANTGCFILFSLRARPRLIDIIQANSFVASNVPLHDAGKQEIGATMADLRHLLTQFLGEAEANRTLCDIAMSARISPLDEMQPVSPAVVRAAERVLAGVIGAPSARNVVAIAMAAGQRDAEEIGRILDEAGHAVHFSRELLQTTLESLPQGVCVVDGEAQIVAWNTRYLEFLGLAADSVHVGKALASLLALATIGENAQSYRQWREAQMRGASMREELTLIDGRSFTLAGRPLAGGDYLMTLTDITDLKQAEQVLTQNQEVLEQKVEERTRALTEANTAIDAARRDAEQATGAQRRFVAAASHDLVQPLHAARLFIGNALLSADDPAQHDLLQKADQAVEGAHRLLHALLKLSQLELGALCPRLEPVDAGAMLASLAAEFEPMAKARRLELVVLPTTRWVRTDRDLLRSILQNLLVNALRYTPQGRVVVLVRRAGAALRFEVRDTGVGIADEHLPTVFREFSRLAEGQGMADGAGLGLSIVARIAEALGHHVAVASRKGIGSVFSITLPAAAPSPKPMATARAPANLQGLKVLCVEDDEDVLLGTAALIERWGGAVTAVTRIADVPGEGHWDVVIADYKLGAGDGLGMLRDLAARAAMRILVTATPEDGWADSLPREDIYLLSKPMPPLALQRLLEQQARGLNRAPV